VSSLASSQGTAGLQLNKLSEQVLDRSAANMVCGNFGGSKGATPHSALNIMLAVQAELRNS